MKNHNQNVLVLETKLKLAREKTILRYYASFEKLETLYVAPHYLALASSRRCFSYQDNKVCCFRVCLYCYMFCRVPNCSIAAALRIPALKIAMHSSAESLS